MDDIVYEARTIKSIIRLQSIFRGKQYREKIAMMDRKNACALRIQTCFRNYRAKTRLLHCREILALKVIAKFIHEYKARKKSDQQYQNLLSFDKVLFYYPAASRDLTREEQMTPKKALKASEFPRPKSSVTSKKREYLAKGVGVDLKSAVSDARKQANKSKSMKRKTIIELPPPWHDKNPAKISSSQKDEMLYEQKNTFQWAKSELLPRFIYICDQYLDMCDDLISRNEKYSKRIVQYPQIITIPRSSKPTFMRNANEIVPFPERGLYFVASLTSVSLIELENVTHDHLVHLTDIQVNAPLLDVAIQPFSGQIFGVDSRWKLHIFELGISVFERQLDLPIKIPDSSKFIFFDKIGMLWINLLSQGGNLICCDPITLTPTIQFTRETLYNVEYQLVKLFNIIPLSHNNMATGFACSFTNTADIYIFSNDFSNHRVLKHPNIKGLVKMARFDSRIFVWSAEKTIYVYEFKERLEFITFIGSFTVESEPLDIYVTESPNLIYVSCEDSSLHVFLGESIEYPLRIPDSKLTPMELLHAERLIGKMKYTQSRKIFSEFKQSKFTSPAFKICAIPITQKFVIVFGIVSGGTICSLSVVNDVQNIPALEFDSYKIPEITNARKVLFDEYLQATQKLFSSRAKYLELKSNLNHFDSHAITNQMKRMFYPNSKYTPLPELILKTKHRSLYPFVPPSDEKSASIYEIFHFFRRADILPENLMTFPQFLLKFAPESEILDGGEYSIGLTSHLLPVKTDGYYKAISNIVFNHQKISEMVAEINPLSNLAAKINNFTISKAAEGLSSASISRKWLSRTEKDELQARIDKLEDLEDLVKHELMKRVQDGINEQLAASYLDKMLPVPPIDMRIVQKDADPNQIPLTVKPNRNVLLDETFHKTIYDVNSKYILYGRDREQRQIIHALHISPAKFKDFLEHISIVQKVSFASRKISLCVHSFGEVADGNVRVVIAEDPRALPLSHFLKVHSFLGSDPRSLGVANTILCKSLQILYSMHKMGIIVRTFYPENIYLNAETSQTMLGSIFDAQFKDAPIIPLPYPFASPENPFLPPEFFHEPLDKMTTAFDVWQLGMLLLYTITGYLPRSYGSELLEHLGEEQTNEYKIYPRTHFFYDWLRDAKMVGPNERCTGERGECFIRTDECDGKMPTILDLDHYTLLPYKNSKINYDESKLYLLIIASCLQTDPAKRPKVEDILRTYSLGQPSAGSEALDVYLKVPNQDVFTSQFFFPVSHMLKENTFFFTLGVLQALMFHDEDEEDDSQFAFPLENHASDRVLRAVFNLKFMDILVEYAIRRIVNKVKLQEVVPVMTFSDSYFERLLEFLTRLISSVEKGIGPLVPYTMEIVLHVMSMFTCNYTIRFTSNNILSDSDSVNFLVNYDHSPAFMYTYTKVHGLLKYILSSSVSIAGAIKFNDEHSEWYYNQFLTFGEANYNLSHALCYSIDKQKGNAVRTLQSMWNNGQTTAIARIFIDFRIVQKVLLCLHIHNIRAEAVSFMMDCLSALNTKMYDSSFRLLSLIAVNPILTMNINHMMRISVMNDKVRESAISVAKEFIKNPTISNVATIVYSDIIWSMFETIREPLFRNIVEKLVSEPSLNITKVIAKSKFLDKVLRNNEIAYSFNIDQHSVDMATDIFEALHLAKKVVNLLYLQAHKKDADFEVNDKIIISFFNKSFNIIFREADSIAKYLDTQALRETRFDIKETTFLQEKNKAKEMNISLTQNSILECSSTILDLYKNLVVYWNNKNFDIPEDFLEMIFTRATYHFSTSRVRTHPASRMISYYTEMILFSITQMSESSQVYQYFVSRIGRITEIFAHYFAFYEEAEQKNAVESQLSELYFRQRKIRFELFKAALKHANEANLLQIFKFIVEKMITNPLNMRIDTVQRNTDLMRFPVRSEALAMIDYLVRNIEKYKRQFLRLCDTVNNFGDKFVENERKMMQIDDNVLLIDQSIKLMEIVIKHKMIIEDTELNSLIISMRARYVRPVEECKLCERKAEAKTLVKDNKHRQSFASSATTRIKSARRTTILAPTLATRTRPATAITKRSYGTLK